MDRSSSYVMLYTAFLIAVTLVGASFVILPQDRLSSPDTFDWPDDWAAATLTPASFRDGDGDPYGETDDAYILSDDADRNFGTATKLFVDGSGCKVSPSSVCKTLIKFPDFIGPNSGQVPLGSTIQEATLDLVITNKGWTQDVYQVTESWGEATATWNAFDPDGTPDTKPRHSVISPRSLGLFSIDITSIVQAWARGEPNEGILLASTHADGVDYESSESANPPSLTVQFVPPARGLSRYSVQDLGAPSDHKDGVATAINEAGQIVGHSTNLFSGETRAFRWEDGVFQDLGIAEPSWALDINDAGQVVGHRCFDPPDEACHAFLWFGGDVIHLPAGAEGDYSFATGINNRGQIVGYDTPGLGAGNHATLWENGNPVYLGTLGGDESLALAINDAGEVVGRSLTDVDGVWEWHAFLWKDGVMTDLGALPGNQGSSAFDVNDAGQVVGSSWETADPTHAALWEDGVWTDLGEGPSEAYAANEADQIVGWKEEYDEGGRRSAILWQGGTSRHLFGLGGDYTIAHDLNEAGQIVGTSETTTDVLRAVLWTKAPHEIQYLGPGAAYAINGAGQIVGTSGETAVLWEDNVKTDLGALPGDLVSVATDINDAGQVVGWSANRSQYPRTIRAFLWEDGVMTDLGLGTAYAINEAGQVVGTSDGRAVLWQGGVMTDLGRPNWTETWPVHTAMAINDEGQVVVVSDETGFGYDLHAFLWDDGVWTNVSTDQSRNVGEDMNNAGQVAGWSGGLSRFTFAWSWDDTVRTTIPSLGGHQTEAHGINEAGHIVGHDPTSGDPWRVWHAWLWKDDEMTDLGTLVDGGDSFALGINDAGWIVGSATHHDGASHAVLWMPVIPAPAPPTTVSYQKGDGGAYSETNDAFLYNGAPNTNYGSNAALYVDAADCIAGTTVCRTLVAFPNVIGPNAGQVPAGATIISATLELTVTNAGGTQLMYQVAEAWTESGVTWNTFATPGMPESKGPTLSFSAPVGVIRLNITAIVQNWASGDANLGLFIWSTSANGADYGSSESASPPKLIVTFRPP